VVGAQDETNDFLAHVVEPVKLVIELMTELVMEPMV